MTTYTQAIELVSEDWAALVPALASIRGDLDSGELRFARIEWAPGDATLYRLVILPWAMVNGGTEYLVSLLGPGSGCYPFHMAPHPGYLAGKFGVSVYTAKKLAMFLAAWFGEPEFTEL